MNILSEASFAAPDVVLVLEGDVPLDVWLAPEVCEPLALEVELPELEGLLTTVTVVRVVHCAWLLAEASPCWYGKNVMWPEVSSWTKEVTPAKYDALESLLVGPAKTAVVLL